MSIWRADLKLYGEASDGVPPGTVVMDETSTGSNPTSNTHASRSAHAVCGPYLEVRYFLLQSPAWVAPGAGVSFACCRRSHASAEPLLAGSEGPIYFIHPSTLLCRAHRVRERTSRPGMQCLPCFRCDFACLLF